TEPQSGRCTRTDRERTPSPVCRRERPTGATITTEEPYMAELVMVKSCLAELVSTVSFYLNSERSGAQVVEESFLKDLPKLSEQVARELDGELTLVELHKVLKGMENGRAP
ncbi:hypothetical protein QTP86_023817, partial [Hemibagrus guttatus]